RTALFNLVLSGGLLPPPRRSARNEKKDKRSLVEKEIDTGACLIDAHSKGVTSFREHQSIAPPESREALTAAALSLVCSFPAARSSHFWTPIGIKPGDSSILRAAMLTTGLRMASSHPSSAGKCTASSSAGCKPVSSLRTARAGEQT